jgi:hypothetical protein
LGLAMAPVPFAQAEETKGDWTSERRLRQNGGQHITLVFVHSTRLLRR